MTNQINQARWLAVVAATGIALYLCWLMLRPFVIVLEWATVLVIVFYPIHTRLTTKIKRGGLSALVSSVLVILIIVVPFAFLTIALVNELAGMARSLPGNVTRLIGPDTTLLGRLAKWAHETANIDVLGLQALIVDQVKSGGMALVGQSVGIVGNIVTGIAKVFFVVFTMYYLFRDGGKIVQALPDALPLSEIQSRALITRTSQVVSASVYGVLTIAVLQGVLGGVAFWILNVPSPILWAVVLAFVCMIPIAGSFFVWLPASGYLMLSGQWISAILLILWGILVISTVDNFLRPRIIKNQTKLHELFVFFSVLGGISVFGLLGVVLGPVVLAITLGLLQTFKQAHNEHSLAGNLHVSDSHN